MSIDVEGGVMQNIPQRVVQRLIVSMCCRCQDVIKACGGHN